MESTISQPLSNHSDNRFFFYSFLMCFLCFSCLTTRAYSKISELATVNRNDICLGKQKIILIEVLIDSNLSEACDIEVEELSESDTENQVELEYWMNGIVNWKTAEYVEDISSLEMEMHMSSPELLYKDIFDPEKEPELKLESWMLNPQLLNIGRETNRL